MKLVSLATLLSFALIKAQSQKIHHEQLPLPPQYQRPFNGAFQSESSLYLPPESNSPLPYFPMKNIDKLQFQYLPPSGTKAPPIYQTAFPIMVSSIPNFDDDDSNDDDDNDKRVRSTPQTPENNQNNRTHNQGSNQKDMRSMSQSASYRQPIDRADNIKFNPFQMGNFGPPMNQAPQNRRMIISQDTKRSDLVPDQVKTASFQGNHFIPPPLGFSVSTTEPAIPILRLSNEMDLDGSFSYEALGADQTHYVQHSRMENMGTEKEEQVVEGSYSYVGDNGQTYTVHYVADSNGFRASGDHLPVAPPVPEIIQRSVQYNLAEEAKRPQHQKSWQDDERDNSYFEKEKNAHFVLPAQAPHPPPRNLFTGRQPEAFSYSYSHGSNQEERNNDNNNNLASAASNQVVKTVDFKKEQTQNKPNAGPIAPQITFLASQGAHVPALSAPPLPPPQPSISRMFANERLPQLINYEAALKDNDPEAKGLWRWQYGINSNNNETPAKSTISRSGFSGDDIMINFSDMTPEQYTSMLRSEVDTNSNNGNGVEQTHQEQNATIKNYQNTLNEYDQQYQTQQYQYQNYQQQQQNDMKQQQQQNDMKRYQHEFATQQYTQHIPKQPTESIQQPKSEKQQQQPQQQQTKSEILPPYQNQYYNYQQVQQQPNDIKQYQHEFATQQNTQIEPVQQTKTGQQTKSEIVQPYQNQYYNYQQPQPSQSADQYYHSTTASLKSYPESTVAPLSSTTQAQVTQMSLKRDPQLEIVNNNYQDQQQHNLKPAENVRSSESRYLIPPKHQHQGILTRHHFIPPSQTITQSYDYEDENMSYDDFYEARKMKSYNLETLKILSSTMMPMTVQTTQSQYGQTSKIETQNQQAQYPIDQTYSAQNVQNEVQRTQPVYEHTSAKVEPFTEEEKTSPSPVYIPSTTPKASFKFSDFIVKEEGFSPVTVAVSEPKEQPTTTPESSIEHMFENNIFLKNMFSVIKNEANKQNSIKEEVKTEDHPKTQIAESKSDKPLKPFSKSFQYTKTSNTNKKPLDISQVLHYVANKNGFEPIKIKPKNKPILENHSQQQRSETYYQNLSENKSYEREEPKNSLSPRQQEELRGVIKNYKVLQRNNNANSQQFQYKPEFNQPMRLMELQPPNTPPLGRAGPTVKAYLPPIYV